MKTILVTGAAGFIGSSLVDALLERGDRVVGIDNFNDAYDPMVKRDNVSGALRSGAFSLHEIDICDESELTSVFRSARPDVVVHLAARAGVRPSLVNPTLYHQVNIIGSQHVFDACREVAPSHLVFASSSSVYGGCTEAPFHEELPIDRPVSPYAATKRMNELMGHVYSHVYGLNITMLRFFTVYGPRQRPDMAIHKFAALIDRGEPISMYGDGTTARDYTYIADILDGVLKAIDRPFRFEIFNLGEQHTTRLRELIDLLSHHMGKPARIEQTDVQPGDVGITFANVDKARAMLGYEPKVALDRGIREFVEWYRHNREMRSA